MNLSSFATANYPSGDRIDAWSEVIWAAIGTLHTQVFGAEALSGHVKFGDVLGVKLCRAVVTSPHQVARTAELIRRDDRGVLKVVFQLKGYAHIEQGGKQLVLGPGEWSVYDPSRPYKVVNPEAIEFLAMLVPRERLMKPNLDVSRYALQRFSSTSGLGKLIGSYVAGFIDEISSLGAESATHLVASAIELVQLAVAEHVQPHGSATASALLTERIKTYIDRHLRDPDFSIDRIAGVMHCSKRYLHKTFKANDETISHFLWNRRLDRCCADLIDPALRDKSITLIAFSWGFNNAAHFSRCFKARFGVSPSDYRLGSCTGDLIRQPLSGVAVAN